MVQKPREAELNKKGGPLWAVIVETRGVSFLERVGGDQLITGGFKNRLTQTWSNTHHYTPTRNSHNFRAHERK